MVSYYDDVNRNTIGHVGSTMYLVNEVQFIYHSLLTLHIYAIYKICNMHRYSRICSDFSSFQAKSLQLCSRLIKQGYKYFKLKSTFKTFLSRQPLVRIKYKQKVASMLKDCLVLPHIVLPHLQRNVTTRRPKGRLT